MSAVAVPTRRGGRLPALAGLLLGAGLGLVAGAQPWWRAVGEGTSVRFTGTDTTAGLCSALALVALAGVLLALVLRARGRRVLAVLLALVGAGALVLGASRPRPSANAVRSQVREVSLADQFALTGTAWPWVFAAGGLLVLAAALLMLRTAARWPVRAARFERGTGPVRVDLDDPAAVWRSMDAGVDPTLVAEEADRGSGSESTGADVHEPDSGDTMGRTAQPGRADRSARSTATE